MLSAVFILCLNQVVFSQSKKDIKTNKIKTAIENVTLLENGKEITYQESYTSFDKNGNIKEQVEYNKDGSIRKKIIQKYDISKNKIEELEYEGSTMVKKQLFSYNPTGDKTLEEVYDGTNKLMKKSIYIYTKGLKVEKKIYDGNNVLLETHKYSYKK